MGRKIRLVIGLILSLACLLAAAWLALGQKQQYDAGLGVFPGGSTIAGIPVGGLTAQAAGLRVAQVYSLTPVELRIGSAQPAVPSAVQISPSAAGQRLDLQAMLDAAEKSRSGGAYWAGYWNYLWNRRPAGFAVPLACGVAVDQLKTYLQTQIGSRYDQPPLAAAPVPGDVRFSPGRPGMVLDLNDALEPLQAALCSPTARTVDVAVTPVGAQPAEFSSLGPTLEVLTQVAGFDGMIEVYLQDLKTGQDISYAFNQGREVPPGIAFTGASTIKIPVMISAYRRVEGALPPELLRRMELMIDLSDNGSTDEVMKQALDENIAPVQVTQDMQTLGLKDTFLAGFFYPGAPLLDRYQTPANTRTDLNTQPDIYNQTTAGDMGRLLAAIQRCAADGSGPLTQTFAGQITQAKCQEMTALLKKNRKGVLLETGLPEGTPIAHKYGWVTDSTDGLLHTASDAAVVYTPGGDFVFTVYLYHPDQLPWDDCQRLVARLATAAYNFYNQGQ